MNDDQNVIEKDEEPEKAKPASFRLTPKTKEKLDKIMNGLQFSNADEFFQSMIDLFEKDSLKTKYPKRIKELETFEILLTKLSSIFIASLEMNQVSESSFIDKYESLKIDFDNKVKDYESSLLQEKNKSTELEKNFNELNLKLKDLIKNENLLNSLKTSLEERIKLTELDYVATKEILELKNNHLTTVNQENKELKEKYSLLCAENSTLISKSKDISEKLNEISIKNEYLQKEIDLLKGTISELKIEKKEFTNKQSETTHELLIAQKLILETEREKSKFKEDLLLTENKLFNLEKQLELLQKEIQINQQPTTLKE